MPSDPPRTLAELATPCALVALDVVERNCERMSATALARDVTLRPHVKTHKCVEAARLATRGHFGGVTVSTLAEAEHFGANGFANITYAVPIAPRRIEQAVALSQRLERLNLLVDNPTTVTALAAAATRARTSLHVLLKVDCGYHRAGVEPHRPEAAALVQQVVQADGLHFEGLLTHAGHSYACVGREAIAEIARQERDVVVAFAKRLRADGVEVKTVSVGSTPTMSVGPDLSGVTEIRPGNYVFYDAFQAAIGSCTLDDAAFSVLAAVIGSYPHDGRLVIDAGALALSKDAGASHVVGEEGYGTVCRLDGGRLDGLTLTSLSQEHGIVRGDADRIAALPVGSCVRIIANHACLAAACHDRFYVVRGTDIVDTWRPVSGW